jgi:hypothetical protein
MASLPLKFGDLEVFVSDWALKSEVARFNKLHQVTLPQLRVFYDAMLPKIEEILLYLNQYKIQELPADAKILFYLAMTFAETAHPIDLNWADVDFPDAYPWDKFEFRTVSAAEN